MENGVQYEFIIKDKSGAILGVFQNARNRSYKYYLNKPGSASFKLSASDPKVSNEILGLRDKEIYIYRDGVLEWGGELSSRSMDINGVNDTVTLNAKGFIDLLSQKVVGNPANPPIYLNTDSSQIALAQLVAAQTGTNADLGITAGSLAVAKLRDRTIDNVQTLKDFIEGMSNLNLKDGFDFDVDFNKQFSTWYPFRGTQKTEIVFELGKNILSATESLDATNISNQVVCLGAGQGADMLIVTRDSDPYFQTKNKIRQSILACKDNTETQNIIDKGDRQLATVQEASQIISISYKGSKGPDFDSFGLGDSVRVIIKNNILDIDDYFRIYGIEVTVDDNNNDETIKLIFNP